MLSVVYKDQVIGALMTVASIAFVVFYAWWLFFPNPWQWWAITIPLFVAIAVVLGIVAWIGWTLATTPPPKPIEEIEKEIKAEEEKEAKAEAEAAPTEQPSSEERKESA